MSAYLVGHITVTNEEIWQKYVSGVRESLSAFESKVIFRGRLVSVLAGSHEHTRVAVIEFFDHVTLDIWFQSDKYQFMIPLRDEVADIVMTTYES